jgi:hypothetical protein
MVVKICPSSATQYIVPTSGPQTSTKPGCPLRVVSIKWFVVSTVRIRGSEALRSTVEVLQNHPWSELYTSLMICDNCCGVHVCVLECG